MILYSDNPNLNKKVVTTARGDKEYRVNCQFIKNKHYRRGRDCFHVNNKWHRFDSGLIVFDHEKQKWILRQSEEFYTLQEGVVSVTEEGHVEMGYYTPNLYNNCKIDVGGSTRDCYSSEILRNNGYVEDIGSGRWYCKNVYKGTELLRRVNKIRTTQDFTRKGYNIEDNKEDFEKKCFFYEKYKIDFSKDVRQYAKFLNGLSMGVEIESSVGNLPDWLQYRHGIVACRDGSINGGGEWVTVPMEGAKALQNLVNLSNSMTRRLNTDINCSLHIHMGNVPLDRTFLCAIYILGYKMQDSLLEMFPYYKTNPEGIKKKNYCQKLKKLGIHTLKDSSKEGYDAYIKAVFEKIFTFLSDGVPPDRFYNRNRGVHPIAQKWSRPSRYYWLNLHNMIFGGRGTVEHRLHEGTLNGQKIINWVFICAAIINYAKKYTKDIFTSTKKITMEKILNFYREEYPKDPKAVFLSDYLIAYYNERKTTFAKDKEKGDYVSNHWQENDKEYVFNYNGVTHLF